MMARFVTLWQAISGVRRRNVEFETGLGDVLPALGRSQIIVLVKRNKEQVLVGHLKDVGVQLDMPGANDP